MKRTMEPSIIEKIKGKRLVFTVTPGRNGSHYLAELLALLPKVTSYHKPAPYDSQTEHIAVWQPQKNNEIENHVTL